MVLVLVTGTLEIWSSHELFSEGPLSQMLPDANTQNVNIFGDVYNFASVSWNSWKMDMPHVRETHSHTVVQDGYTSTLT